MKTAEDFYKEKFDVDIPNGKGVDMIKFAEEYAASLQPQPVTDERKCQCGEDSTGNTTIG
jgi:hypothetical protein